MAEESCGIYTRNSEWWVQGRIVLRRHDAARARRGQPEVPAGDRRAAGKIAWQIPDLGGGILASGVMTTAGGLLFYGDAPGGAFVAADAKSGALLWHFNTGQNWKAGPMTYALEGRQYIGIAAGSIVIVFALP